MSIIEFDPQAYSHLYMCLCVSQRETLERGEEKFHKGINKLSLFVRINVCPVLFVIALFGQQVSLAAPFLVFKSLVFSDYDPHLCLLTPTP